MNLPRNIVIMNSIPNLRYGSDAKNLQTELTGLDLSTCQLRPIAMYQTDYRYLLQTSGTVNSMTQIQSMEF